MSCGLAELALRAAAVVKNYGVAFFSPILSYLQWVHVVSRFKVVEPFHREYRATGRFPFFTEDIHFNEAGHAIVAREVVSRGLAGRESKGRGLNCVPR